MHFSPLPGGETGAGFGVRTIPAAAAPCHQSSPLAQRRHKMPPSAAQLAPLPPTSRTIMVAKPPRLFLLLALCVLGAWAAWQLAHTTTNDTTDAPNGSA